MTDTSSHMPLLERLRKGANCVIFLDGSPGPAADVADMLRKAADEIERLRGACQKMLIGGNHIATYRSDEWPDVGTDHHVALEKMGSGKEYDMWCCWNALMQARDSLTP